MRRLLAWLAGTLLLLVLAAILLVLTALDSTPLVSRSATISPQSVAEARWLLLTNDPRRLRSGEARRTAIPAALIDEGINHVATRFLHGRGALLLGENSAEIRLTLQPPQLSGNRFLNISATVQEVAGQPHISSARLGRLPIPPALLELALHGGFRLAGYQRELTLALAAVQELRFEPERRRVIVGYIWEPALLERARSIAVNPEDLARIRSAHEMLAGLLDHHRPGARVDLPALLGPLLDIDGSDQRANRRAAIFVLAAYLSEKNLAALIPEAANWPKVRPVMPTLLGRGDSAQHFVVSAALAAWAGEPIAEAIGLYKEIADAHHGSGFSFADLAADRAGTAFGELLLGPPDKLDRLLKTPFVDSDLAPSLAGLPEGLGQREFRQRFGDTGSPAYRQIVAEIDRRLAALPLYRPGGKS
ncbi:hypothetical protein ACLIKD_04190 [Azonexus sp. IMCC34842]|uniref:hypothetical protein n=1 Tax=Azonexus sp. IMCC34842 TaxID=3420950 RepID=UPI003D0BF817